MSKTSNHSTKTMQNEQSQAMFFKNPVPISYERHAKAGLHTTASTAFAADSNSTVVNVNEFVEAAKFYPIVFTKDLSMPVVVLGLNNKNDFIVEDGKWVKGHYIPAYVRKYPFIFMHDRENNRYVMCIDEDSEHFCKKVSGKAVPLYQSPNEPSELVKSALEFSKLFQQSYDMTQRFIDDLKAMGLFTEYSTTLQLSSGRTLQMKGFQIIDEKKLNALSEKQFLELRSKGWLPAIYCSLISISNWQTLADIASALETAK